MAQLPPKNPNTNLCWPELSSSSSSPKITSMPSFPPDVSAANATQNPFWTDEFHDFSSEKRHAHRRSVSDSIDFLEDHMSHVNPRNVPPSFEAENEFDKFDDEKFLTMFDNDKSEVAMPLTFSSSSKSSSPSPDHNNKSNLIYDKKEVTNKQVQLQNPNEDQQHQHVKNESDEVENQITKEQEMHHPSNDTLPSSSDIIIDPKRVKRILANRKSAQRSRVRKLQYINELERSVTSLQAEVSALTPRVAFLDRQRVYLSVNNGDLKQRIAALNQDKLFKDALQNDLRIEIERLRQVCQQQKFKNKENGS